MPSVTRGEALLALRAWRATGRKEVPPETDGNCPMLDARSGKCLVYADRGRSDAGRIFARRRADHTSGARCST